MERLCQITKLRFKKHWKTIACQIHSVNDHLNPKRAFLFDCGKVEIEKLREHMKALKAENLVSKDIAIVQVQEDIFILNVSKFHQKSSHVLVDVTESLPEPEVISSDFIFGMLKTIDNQLLTSSVDDVIDLLVKEDWCIPTIFGYFINYPILYFLRSEGNCLSCVDLQVHQVSTHHEILISFSVPSKLVENNKNIQQTINSWLQHFNDDVFSVRSFNANYPTIIL